MRRKCLKKHETQITLSTALALICLSSVNAQATTVPSCEDIFSSDTSSPQQADKSVNISTSAGVAKAQSHEKHLIISGEVITNTNTGAQLYLVVPAHAKDSAPGLYKRTREGWSLFFPGHVLADDKGTPIIRQLSLSQTDGKGYSVAVVDGQVVLFTEHSEINDAQSYIRFGSPESPLFEAGSMQKRSLVSITDSKNISIYQDPLLSELGSQLVLVSVKLPSGQAVGEGMTLAFDVLPNKADKDIHLNQKPIVLDYKFRTVNELFNLVAGQNSKQKILYSEILVEQLQNSDFDSFGSHVEHIKAALLDFISPILSAVKPADKISSSTNKIAFDMTHGKAVRDVTFSKTLFNNGPVVLNQHYYTLRGQSKTQLVIQGQNFEIPGKVDLLPDGQPAVWAGISNAGGVEGVLVSVEGTLSAYVSEFAGGFDRSRGSLLPVELGKSNELFNHLSSTKERELPISLVAKFYVSGEGEDIRRGLIVFSGKMSSGAEFTGVKKLSFFIPSTLVGVDSFQILPFALSREELNARFSITAHDEVLFDAGTPKMDSIDIYKAVYDPSLPHLNLKNSTQALITYTFKKPNSVLPLGGDISTLSYAEFTTIAGAPNPSGLYFNISHTEITGNEESRSVGQLLSNPHKTKASDSKETDLKKYTFGLADLKEPGARDDDDEVFPRVKTGTKAGLFAIDVHRSNGLQGFQYILMVRTKIGPDSKEYIWTQIPITLPAPWSKDITSFHDVVFVQGKRKRKPFLHVLISVKGKDTKEATFGVIVDLTSLKHLDQAVSQPIIVSNTALDGNSLTPLIGFNDSGSPSIVMTPELDSESSSFTVFDLSKGTRYLPNQDFSGSRQKIKYGGWSDSSSSKSGSFISYEDEWRFFKADVEKEYQDLGKSKELAQFDSFVELGRELDKMANADSPARRMILVVPPGLRELVWDFVLSKSCEGSRYTYSTADDDYTERGKGKPTNVTTGLNNANVKLKTHLFDAKKSSQNQFFANSEEWDRHSKHSPTERDFFLARLADIESVNNGFPSPVNGASGFQIREISAGESSDITSVATHNVTRPPHALYLLAAGGPMELRDFRNDRTKPSSSMLILATPEEMKQMESKAEVEIDNGLLDKYDIVEIKDPDEGSMATSLASVFNHPDIRSLEYTFSAKEIKSKAEMSEQENFQVVLDYAISRFSFLLGQKRESRFETFMRFRTAFASAVLSDKEVRRTRIINKFFIERVLTQVFDIPMNLATLPADDPMKILAGKDALIKLQEAGYSGPFRLKSDVIDTLLTQTRADAGKPVPSSIILFGNTGSGKTFMFRSLVKMLKLKLYDFANPQNNDDASAIIISVSQINEDGVKGGVDGAMDIKTVLGHLNAFLSGPNGYRGFILIDDIHAAKDSVKAKVLGWLRGVFEAQDGMYTATDPKTSRTIRRPVRNLNLFLTLNPTADQDQISKYTKDKAKPTSEEILLASLSTNEFKIEPSFLRRFGRIINLDFMPAGAKGPELIKSVARASNTLLNTNSRIALVAPEVIGGLVKANETVDARSFLSASTSSLIEVASADQSSGALVLVIPAMNIRQGMEGTWGFEGEMSPSEKITKWVRQNTRTLSLDSSIEGNLVFLKTIVDAFRIPAYESLIMAVQEDRRFAGDPVLQKTMLAPVLAAISDHLSNGGNDVSIKDLNINASDFGMRTAGERDSFRKILDRLRSAKSSNQPLIPAEFQQVESVATTWQHVSGSYAAGDTGNLTYRDVLAEYSSKNQVIVRQRLAEVMHVDDVASLPDPGTWLIDLAPRKDEGAKLVGRKLADSLWDYLPRLFEVHAAPSVADKMNTYAATRLYLYSLDRTIIKMPWVNVSKFLLKALERVTEDQVMSQKQGVQNFLFTDPNRLIKPTLADLAFQIIASSSALEAMPPETRTRMKENFDAALVEFLSEPSH